eukprot:768247-Rhodomonas_salina.3
MRLGDEAWVVPMRDGVCKNRFASRAQPRVRERPRELEGTEGGSDRENVWMRERKNLAPSLAQRPL